MDVAVVASDPTAPGRVASLTVFHVAHLVEPVGPAAEAVGRAGAWQGTSARLDRARLRREQRRREARELGGRRLRALAMLERVRVLTATVVAGTHGLPKATRRVVEFLANRLPNPPRFLVPPNSRVSADLDIVDLLECRRWEVLHVQEPRFADAAARAVARRRADGHPAAWLLDLDRVPVGDVALAPSRSPERADGPALGREGGRAPADAVIATSPALATALRERFRLSQAPTVLTWGGAPQDSARLTTLYRDLLERDRAKETVDPALSATLAATAARRAQSTTALSLDTDAAVSAPPAQGA